MTKTEATTIRRCVRSMQRELDKLGEYTKGCFGMGLHGDAISKRLSAILSLLKPDCEPKTVSKACSPVTHNPGEDECIAKIERNLDAGLQADGTPTPELKRLVKSLRCDFDTIRGKASVSVYRSDYDKLLTYAEHCLEK